MKHTDETKRKMSLSGKGRRTSNETKKKLSQAHKGKILTEEHRLKIGKSHKGKVVSLETRRRMGAHQIGELNRNWQGGIRPYPPEFNEMLRQEIRKRDGNVCRMCNEKRGRELSVHHIDYDKQNNSKENLIALCEDCHRKTNYERGFWTGFLLGYLRSKYGY